MLKPIGGSKCACANRAYSVINTTFKSPDMK